MAIDDLANRLQPTPTRPAPHPIRSELKFRRFWQTLGWVMVVVVAWVSLSPHPPAPPSFLGWDKAQHFLTYAVLMFWFRQAFSHPIGWTAFLLFLGIALEFLQGCTEVRTADPFDVIANATGLAIGLTVAATPAGKVLAVVDSRLQALARDGLRP